MKVTYRVTWNNSCTTVISWNRVERFPATLVSLWTLSWQYVLLVVHVDEVRLCLLTAASNVIYVCMEPRWNKNSERNLSQDRRTRLTISKEQGHWSPSVLAQREKKFPDVYGNGRFTNVLTRARHWSQYWARWTQSISHTVVIQDTF
jgi:hypothetical protein